MPIPAPEEFVRLVKEQLGVESPTDLAKALGLTEYGAPQRVRRWVNARNGPNYEGTMLMLQAAGWLNIGAGDSAEATQQRDADVEALLEFVREVTAALDRLEIDEPEQARPPHQGKRRTA